MLIVGVAKEGNALDEDLVAQVANIIRHADWPCCVAEDLAESSPRSKVEHPTAWKLSRFPGHDKTDGYMPSGTLFERRVCRTSKNKSRGARTLYRTDCARGRES